LRGSFPSGAVSLSQGNKMLTVKTISTVQCQICLAQGLTAVAEDKLIGRKVVCCENEDIRHIKVSGRHYLCRTRLSNDMEELTGSLSWN
jgi:hypothetical protein